MDKSSSFTLEKVTLRGSGQLSVFGTVDEASRIARFLRPRYEVGVRRRDGEALYWFPAIITGSNAKGFSLKACLATESDRDATGYSDVFFRRVGDAAENVQRVSFHDEGEGWTAYPTKYGNFSFKRGNV